MFVKCGDWREADGMDCRNVGVMSRQKNGMGAAVVMVSFLCFIFQVYLSSVINTE